MKVEKFNYNDIDDLYSNTYVISDSNNKAVVVDPSMDNDGIINYLEKNHLAPVAVLLTHAHFDHIRGLKRLVDKYHLPVYIHALERATLTNLKDNCSLFMSHPMKVDVESNIIEVNDKLSLKLLENDIVVIHTPFHTLGSVCYYIPEDKILFSGDTLFKGSVGRSDLPTSTEKYMKETFDKLKSLPRDVKVYPGHDSNTTIEFELSFNRFLNN